MDLRKMEMRQMMNMAMGMGMFLWRGHFSW